ncbi:MAG: T9SS type B sorting domain-containing protein [Saprospiraceae bacterium]|nr:T9SS type B sorting domain-containing protein [Saprospiraceae bacterium]
MAVNKTNSIYVPNAFSPNGDNINDLLTLSPSSAVRQIVAFYLFDRTGALVYEVTNRTPEEVNTQGWDGMFNGYPASPGVYIYVLKVELIDESILFLEGDVSLIR